MEKNFRPQNMLGQFGINDIACPPKVISSTNSPHLKLFGQANAGLEFLQISEYMIQVLGNHRELLSVSESKLSSDRWKTPMLELNVKKTAAKVYLAAVLILKLTIS